MAVQFHFFAPKIFSSLVVGSGSLIGGGAIYWYQMPRTWRELLTKEGFLFLSTEDDYKGMFHDQQKNEGWTKETTLKDAVATDVQSKASPYCSKELDKALAESSDSDYENTKRKLISFCTSGGIKTVKARLIQGKKTNWIEDNQEDKWQTVFAIYRYEPRFIDWLKEDSKDGSLSEKTTVNAGWEKLKKACTNLLTKSYGELTDDKYFEYGSWWCTDLGYKTVQERINKDSSWQQETEGDAIKKTWKDTKIVTDQIKKDSNKESEELEGKDYKDWCETQLKKNLKEEEYYKDKYTMIKSVCKKAK